MIHGVTSRPVSATPQPDRLKEVADQFEAFFVEQLLKQMRSANAALRDDKASTARSTYEGWQDEQTARSIVSGGGIGLGKMLYEQLQQQAISRQG